MRVLIVGCGYVGLPLGAELVQQGHQVYGVRRSQAAASQLRAVGITPITADITQPDTLRQLPGNLDWVALTVASSRGGGAEAYREVYFRGITHLIAHWAAAPPRRLVYTSSTGVYGQDHGEIVTEQSPTEPTVETAKILVATETLLREAARQHAFPATILRVAGIYGPDRGYWLQSLRQGQALIPGEGRRILNMIHREDVVGSILAALAHGQSGEVYNAVDDEPVPLVEFLGWLAEQLGLPPPLHGPAETEADRKRGLTSKRVANQRLKTELDYRFKYPTFREGYRAELERLGVRP